MKRLFIGAIVALGLMPNSALASDTELTRSQMINTMAEVGIEVVDLCNKTKLIYGNPSTIEMCHLYNQSALLYIKGVQKLETGQEVYPVYMKFLSLSRTMSKAFMLDMIESDLP